MKYLFSQTCQFLALLLFFLFFDNDDWFEIQLKNMLLVLVSYILFIVISSLSYFFRPLEVTVVLNNSIDRDEKSTTLYIEENKLKTVQSQRTIDLKVTYKRRGSFWWKVLILILRNNIIKLSIAPIPSELDFQVIDGILQKDIKLNNSNGFNINLNHLFLELSKSDGKYGLTRKYHFFVVDHPDVQPPINSTYMIVPEISLKKNKSSLSLLINRILCHIFLGFKTEYHEIKYYKRG